METPWKILIAGAGLHERARRALAACTFFGRPPELLVARNSAEAIEQVLRHPDIAMLLTDSALEGNRAGLHVVETIRGHLRQTRMRIVLSSEGFEPEPEFIQRHDVHDFTDGSVTDQKLQAVVHAALGYYRQLDALERARSDLNEVLDANEKVHAELVTAIETAISLRASETGNHLRRVAEYARVLGVLAGLDDADADLLARAAPLHDAGKIAIPDSVLAKPDAHDEAEQQLMRSHARLGAELLGKHDSPVLQAATIIASEHHERWDGRGYPAGWKGEQIHLYGRIVALVDVFDALSHDRAHKKAWPLERVLAYIREERGARFDPHLVDLFLGHLEQFVAIFTRLPDPPLMH